VHGLSKTIFVDHIPAVHGDRQADGRARSVMRPIRTSAKKVSGAADSFYRVGQKTGPVLALITQQRLLVERRVIREKFQNAVKNKRQIWIVKHPNILCLICINIRHPRNSAKLDCNTYLTCIFELLKLSDVY